MPEEENEKETEAGQEAPEAGEEEAKEEAAGAGEEVIEGEEEEGKYPYPMAAVVRQIKKKTHGQMISSKVKIATNNFLGYVTEKVAEEMAKTRYAMIEMDDFTRATQPFFAAEDLENEKKRVISHLERMRSDIEMLIRDFERKFTVENTDRKFV